MATRRKSAGRTAARKKAAGKKPAGKKTGAMKPARKRSSPGKSAPKKPARTKAPRKKTAAKKSVRKTSSKKAADRARKPGATRRSPLRISKPSGPLKAMDVQIFHDIGKTITSNLELDRVLQNIMDKVQEMFRPRNWSLLLVDEETNELFFEVVVGVSIIPMRDVRISVGEGVSGWVAKHRKPIHIPDVTFDTRYNRMFNYILGFKARSILCAPLISKHRTLGVIELFNDDEYGDFHPDDLFILSTIADYAAIAIENARNFLKIQELTVTDDVTGLHNTRFLYQALENEIKRSQRYGKHFTLIFIDLDHFKNVNDGYGHLAGSNLLREVGQVFRNILRDVDIVTRYGGDEFVIILPETPKKQGIKATERIRLALNEHEFQPAPDLNIHITASYGVASYPVDAKSYIKVIRLADQAMYRVKEANRDGIAAADKTIGGSGKITSDTEIKYLRSTAVIKDS